MTLGLCKKTSWFFRGFRDGKKLRNLVFLCHKKLNYITRCFTPCFKQWLLQWLKLQTDSTGGPGRLLLLAVVAVGVFPFSLEKRETTMATPMSAVAAADRSDRTGPLLLL